MKLVAGYRVNIQSSEIQIIGHHPFPYQTMISQCLEFTQLVYYPQPSHFGTESDGLIIS